MNREIKFRAFGKMTKKYIKFDLASIYGYEGEVSGVILPDGITPLSLNSGYGNGGVNKDLIIEQFTGLKDRNGIEIYEGDVVKMDDDWMPIGAVQFQQTGAIGWCVEGELGNGYKRRSLLDSVAYEIIGNLNENPELLK
jgi:uncharacterized phage protein (TIGR01671 family)